MKRKHKFRTLFDAITIIFRIIFEKYGSRETNPDMINLYWHNHHQLMLKVFDINVLYEMLDCLQGCDAPYKYQYFNIFLDICTVKASQFGEKYKFEEFHKMLKNFAETLKIFAKRNNQLVLKNDNGKIKKLIDTLYESCSNYRDDIDSLIYIHWGGIDHKTKTHTILNALQAETLGRDSKQAKEQYQD